MPHRARESEPVPLFTRLVKLKIKDGVVIARSRSGHFEREGNMTTSLFLRLVMVGITMLHKHGLLPKFTVLARLDKIDAETVTFALGFKDAPDLSITADVSIEVATQGRDRLNELFPTAQVIKHPMRDKLTKGLGVVLAAVLVL